LRQRRPCHHVSQFRPAYRAGLGSQRLVSYHFCTLFDRHYATRGIALYRSLQQYCRQDFRFTILCMDAETSTLLARLNLPNTDLILPADLGDADLLAVEKLRPRREFCWTCPP